MQYQYVFYLFGFGWVMGTVYDVYNTVTTSSKWLRWLRPILDILFWCLSGGAVYYLTFVTDNGRFRVYTFALLALGYLVYRMFLHHRVVRSAFVIVRMIRGVVGATLAAFDLVIIQPVFWLLKSVWFLAKPLYRLFCQIEALIVTLLHFCLRVLVFPFRPLWNYWGAAEYDKFMDKWEGMCSRVSKWLKNWPQSHS